MHRAVAISVAIATLILSSCVSAGRREFVSDRISVVTRGTGPDVILIPGLAGHRDVWAGAAETLDDRYRLHLVQVNGFAGFAAAANAEGPVAAPVAAEVARYIAEQRLDRPAVIGHSMGGTIGMMVAARHSHLVGRLMVVDMVPFMGQMFGPPGTTAESVRPTADQFRERVLKDPPDAGLLTQMFETMTLKTERIPALLREVRDSDRRTVANSFHELIATDLRSELARITAPVTVLYVIPPNPPMPPAQYDAVMKQQYGKLPGARLVLVDESRHFIQWDQPERFVAEVDTFMASFFGAIRR